MGIRQLSHAIPQEDYQGREDAVELRQFLDAPPTPRRRRPMSRARKVWRYLHPTAWLLLLSIGGPILLRALYVKYLGPSNGPSASSTLIVPALPCDVQPAWSSWSSLFEINVRTGNLSFTAAKLIDVAFDIVVGRGGQAVLAWIAYRVYTAVLTRVAEKGQIRYSLFAAITIEPESTLTPVRAAAAIPGTPHLWAKTALLWMVLAMAYVLAWPTLVSAATSLVAGSVTSLRLDGNGTAPLVPYIDSASYQISHPGVDGRPDPWVLSVDSVTRLPKDSCDMGMFSNHSYGGQDNLNENAVVVNGTKYELGDGATVDCGFYWEGAFSPFELSTVHSVDMDQLFPGRLVCVPDSINYQWGASWELLLLILIVHIAWSVSLLVLWVEASTHSPLVRQGRRMDMWRAILDLALPLMMRLGPGEGMLGPDQLKEHVRHMSFVQYETKLDGTQEGLVHDVHLVAGDHTPAEIEIVGE